jgi:hypothetical protein
MSEEPIDPWYVYEAMKCYGGGFVKALAEAWVQGDSINKAKIQNTWPEYWAEYTKLAKGSRT